MDTLAVTGGAGFIGSNFVHLALAQADAHVVVIDALTYAGHLESLAGVRDHPRFTFVKADIADQAAVEAVFRDFQPRWVVNFAAESHVDRSIDGPRAFVRTNVVGCFELLEAARGYYEGLPAAARRGFRFLQVSTDEVYGTLGATGLFTESTPYAPRSPYSASKAAADHLALAYWHTYALPTLLTNCSNNYGPYQFPEKLIPLTILNAVDGKPLPIYGDGQNIRDWLYVVDHCEGILRVLQEGRTGDQYNIGGHGERTNVQVVDAICAVLDELRPARDNPALSAQGIRRYGELKQFVPDRPGHDRRYGIDASKARRELRWEPRHDFDSGIRQTVCWYLDNGAWCAAVQASNYGRQRLGLGAAQPPVTPSAVHGR